MRAFAIIKPDQSTKYLQEQYGQSVINSLQYNTQSNEISVESLPVVPVKRSKNIQLILNTSVPFNHSKYTAENNNIQLDLIHHNQAAHYYGRSHTRHKLFQNYDLKLQPNVKHQEEQIAGDTDLSYTPNIKNIHSVKPACILIQQSRDSTLYYSKEQDKKNNKKRKKIFCNQNQQSKVQLDQQSIFSLQISNLNSQSIIKTSIVVATPNHDMFYKLNQPIALPKSQGSKLTIFQVKQILPLIF